MRHNQARVSHSISYGYSPQILDELICTHSNQILFGVVAQMALRLDVMDLQVGSVAQLWPLLPQDLLLQRPIGLGKEAF